MSDVKKCDVCGAIYDETCTYEMPARKFKRIATTCGGNRLHYDLCPDCATDMAIKFHLPILDRKEKGDE